MVKTAANRAIYTLNKVTVCGMLNYLTNNIFAEDLYVIINSLLQKYVRREYFTNTMICFAKKYVLHNSFLIILLNNIEMLMNYLKTLKINLMQEYNEIFSEEKHTMIYSSIEELELSNKKRLETLLKEKMKIIVEFLKLTVKNEIETFKEINFQINEVALNEYEKKGTFSQEFFF